VVAAGGEHDACVASDETADAAKGTALDDLTELKSDLFLKFVVRIGSVAYR
jgi:hypothetical protein